MHLRVVTIVCVVTLLKLFLTFDAVQLNLFHKVREENVTYSSIFQNNAKFKNQCLSKCATTEDCKSVIVSTSVSRNYISCLIPILNEEDPERNYIKTNNSYVVWTLKSNRNPESQRSRTTTSAITTTTTTVDTSASTASTTCSATKEQTTELTTAPGPTMQATGQSGLLIETCASAVATKE